MAKSKKTHPTKAVPGAVDGRPSIFTAELGLKICKALLKHGSLREALRKEKGLPQSSTIHEWRFDGKHKEFAEQYDLAKRATIEEMGEEIIEISDEAPTIVSTVFGSNERESQYEFTDAAGISRNKLRVDTRKFLLSKIVPKVYGDKIQHEHDAGPTLLDALSEFYDLNHKKEKQA